MPTNFLFHPPLVHFPIAFYILELILLLFWLAKKDDAYVRFARFAFFAGYLLMIPTMIAGWIDAGGWVPGVRRHASFAFALLALYTLRLIGWIFARKLWSKYSTLLILSSAAGGILVLITGYEGGDLVYGK